ncbi:MAG: metallophosphoesterase [Pseudomonadota bacterium]
MFRRLFSRIRPAAFMPSPAPDEQISVIGDVHGRLDLLEKALAIAPGQIVLVGDYVDRGEDSAGVLRLLLDRPDLICLMGNHEEMMLKFIDDPARHGAHWLRYGGLQTLASFSVTGVAETSGPEALKAARNGLQAAMGPELEVWLRSLPSSWQSGNVAVTHAGADPALPLAQQHDRVLRWGHSDFVKSPRTDGLWIVHGHVIEEAPQHAAGRINVDTGAYATGRLSWVTLADGAITFGCAN